jgi:hypothetical protein
VKNCPLEQYADELLAANPSEEIVILSKWQLQRIAKTELLIDSTRIEFHAEIIDKPLGVDHLRARDRERKRAKRKADAASGNPIVRRGKVKAIQ